MSITFVNTRFGPETDKTKDGICSNCGTCCIDILPLTPLDIRRIKAYVEKHSIRPISHKLNVTASPSSDNQCPFFDPSVTDGNHCTIYHIRPIICKHYTCKVFADPALHESTGQAMFDEATQQPAVKKDPMLFLTPRSMRYSIWPNLFPDLKDMRLIFEP